MSDMRKALINNAPDSQEFASLLEEISSEASTAPHAHSVRNLDLFLTRVYNYFTGKGFFCILWRQALNLLTVLFTIFFAGFLVTYIDYNVLSETLNWSKAVDMHREPHGFIVVCFAIFLLFWLWQLLHILLEAKQNWDIHCFYRDTLSISEDEVQTVEWREVSIKLGQVPRLSVMKDRLTSLDISHRIMRRENYLIALINKDMLSLQLPLPSVIRPQLAITKIIEWGLSFALFDFVFDHNNVLKREVLAEARNQTMARSLRKRFFLMGVASMFLSPFLFIYLVVYFFFKYGEEIKNKPGSLLGSREWSPLARWKFREFNELPHYFQNRLNLSYENANNYINQFPTNILSITARFIAFIAGALLAVILLLGLWDDEMIMDAEIYGRSLLWYAGILGTVVAMCRTVIPDETAVFDPKKDMDEIEKFTHYIPKHWRGRERTYMVRDEFCQLFEYRVIVLLRELLSVLFAPFILMFSLPSCSEDLLQFFRDFTIHVDGVGFVCTCATFEHSEKHGNEKYGAAQTGDKKTRMKQGKMEKSILTFKANNPDWVPPHDGETMLSNLASFMMTSSSTSEVGDIMQHSDPSVLAQSMSILGTDPTMMASFSGRPSGSPSMFFDSQSLGILLKVQKKLYETNKEKVAPIAGHRNKNNL